MAVCLGNIIDLLIGISGMFLHYYGVHAIVCHRVMGHDHIRRHIRADAGTTLDESKLADFRFFVHHHAARQDCTTVDMHIASDSHTIAYHTVIFYLSIVAYMTVGKYKASGSYAGTALGIDTSVYNHMLADNSIIAHKAVRRIAFPTEILRFGTDYGTLEHPHALTEGRALHHARIRHYFAAIAYHGVGIYKCKRMNSNVFADICFRVDVS